MFPPGSSKGGEHANHQRETDPGDQTHPACAGASKLGAQQLRLIMVLEEEKEELVKRESDKNDGPLQIVLFPVLSVPSSTASEMFPRSIS